MLFLKFVNNMKSSAKNFLKKFARRGAAGDGDGRCGRAQRGLVMQVRQGAAGVAYAGAAGRGGAGHHQAWKVKEFCPFAFPFISANRHS